MMDATETGRTNEAATMFKQSPAGFDTRPICAPAEGDTPTAARNSQGPSPGTDGQRNPGAGGRARIATEGRNSGEAIAPPILSAPVVHHLLRTTPWIACEPKCVVAGLPLANFNVTFEYSTSAPPVMQICSCDSPDFFWNGATLPLPVMSA